MIKQLKPNLMRILFSFLVFITMAYGKVQGDPVALSLPRLESLIHQSMEKKKVPGMAVAVVSKGKIIYMRPFGVRVVGQQAPIDQKTLFQVGSLSKAISSTLIAILNQEQKISLDHPVTVIPGATLRHVLSHTTGIPSAGFNALIERGDHPLEVQKKIQGIVPDGEPGEKFAYHNAVYNLLKDVLENNIGISFESLLQKKLLQPLHMVSTSSTWEAFISQENRVAAHILKKTKGKKGKIIKIAAQKVPYRKDYTNFPAAGGMSSNIHDMALFLAAIMGARPDVISPQDLEEFTRPLIHTPDQWHRTHKHRDRITETHYGLGWRHITFAGHPVLFHGGMLRGFCQMVAFLPEQQVGIIVLQNAESSLAFQLSMQFFDWVLGLPSKKWID
jgi:beta-lactamase class C